jgi:release factor glutamine methyltransferase
MTASQIHHHLVKALTLKVSEEEKRAMILWLMHEKLGLSRTDILTGKETNATTAQFDEALRRLNLEEPLQYILGKAEFYGRTFEVNPSVLIPRPETELLVQYILDAVGKSTKGTLLDICTGSGCIAITLALELPGLDVRATDVSSAALEVARRNATSLGANIQFERHDILKEPLPTNRLNVVVSNPPYIPNSEAETLKENITAHEPRLALFVPDEDPLLFHRTIAQKAMKSLNPGGLIIMEIHENFGTKTAAVLQVLGYSDVKILKDLDSKDRFVSGRIPA